VGRTLPGRENGLRTVFVDNYKRNWFVRSQSAGEPYQPEPIPRWDKATAPTALNIREETFTMLDGKKGTHHALHYTHAAHKSCVR
jgi:hypothetical protein